jgi:Ca2+-binding EF-hand superfamily protein
MLVSNTEDLRMVQNFIVAEYKEAFALFYKRGTGAVPREIIGDLLRALGQNPTQAEVAEIVASAPRDGVQSLHERPWNLSG